MIGGSFDYSNWGTALTVLISVAIGGCQESSVYVTEPVLLSPNDVNGTILANDVAAENQNPETAPPYVNKVIEWDIALSNSIMPPAEVRKTIDESCRQIGYDHGVIVAMSLIESRVIADFDCRGEDAI